MNETKKKIGPLCLGCMNLNNGCSGSFCYYPNDCDSYDDGTDPEDCFEGDDYDEDGLYGDWSW